MSTQRTIEEHHLALAADGLASSRSYLRPQIHPLAKKFHEKLAEAQAVLDELAAVCPVTEPGWELRKRERCDCQNGWRLTDEDAGGPESCRACHGTGWVEE